MYFRLNPECYFIRGVKRGAIYDLIDGKIYSLNQQETELMTACEKNNPIYRDKEFLNELKQLRLGNFYPNKTYVQKLRAGSRVNEGDSLRAPNPPELQRTFLEINNSCNRDCWFCGHYGIKRSLGCMGCNKWKEGDNVLDVEKLKNIIDELKNLDCKDIFITGGDLTLAWDRTKDILDYANGKFSNIYITLHQQSLSPEIRNDLLHKAKIIVQTESNYIQSEDLTTLMVLKPEDWASTGNIKGKDLMNDFAIPDRNSLSDLPMLSRKKILPVNMFGFLNNVEYHPCLGHTLTICYNGNVTLCPMMRSHSFGNVSNMDLYTIFEKNWKKINKFWRLNLDEIEKCTSCEFRYTCTDCRALEESLTGKLEGKMLCNYNPKEGEWQ